MSDQIGEQMYSRGFGFVIFKHEMSASEAVQAHFITLMGKQVEIKSAVSKCLLFAELKKLPPQQDDQEQRQTIEFQPQSGTPDGKNTDYCEPKLTSWVDKLLQSPPKTPVLKCETPKQNIPKWVRIFKRWLPGFLNNVSKRLKEGEWYPLSSLKADFRAICGYELDHTSLGYPKLSDFIRSFPGLCCMNIIPVGGRGPATHMVLQPEQARVIPFLTPIHVSLDENDDGDSMELKSLGELPPVSYDNASSPDNSFEEGDSRHVILEESPLHNDANSGVPPRFLEFLKPDPLFLGRPWFNNVNAAAGYDGRNRELRQQERHQVLEELGLFLARV